MMKVQQFIQQNGLDALAEQFDITVKRYDNGYVKLNYSQISSPKFHEICDECRGLVLHVLPDNTSTVVARGFRRFYNLGEGTTSTFQFTGCTAFEKSDGSLTLVSFSPLDNKWIIGTRGMIYAEGNFTFSLTAAGGTFFDWILKAMQLTEEEFQRCMRSFDPKCTYVMEYTAPENLIVCRYPEAKMVLLSIIRNDTGAEENTPSALLWTCNNLLQGGMNVRVPASYEFSSSAELVALADSLPGLQEGFVIVNHDTNERVKIKSKQYVAVHQIRGEGVPSMNRLMELVLRNEQAEVLAYFPEFLQYVTPIEAALATLLDEAEQQYAANMSLESQKDFALAVKDSTVAPLLFKTRQAKTDVRAVWDQFDTNLQSKLLEKYVCHPS